MNGVFNAAESAHLNPLFILAIAIHESGWGRSAIAHDKRNLFGYQAYDASPYESAKGFPSFTEGTVFVMQRIREDYIDPSGPFYGGPHLAGINTRYASDKGWARKVRNYMNRMSEVINQQRGKDLSLAQNH